MIRNNLAIFLLLTTIVSCTRETASIKVEGPYKFETKVAKEEVTFLPYSITFDDKRNRVYVTDTKKCKILVFSPEGELVKEFGDKGEGVSEFLLPRDVGFDRTGNIYVLDNKKIKILDSLGTEFCSSTLKGVPWRFCVKDTNEIYVLTPLPVNNKIIMKYNWKGEVLGGYLESKKEKNPLLRMLLNQGSISGDEEGNLYIAFTNEYRIVKIDKDDQVNEDYIVKSMPYEVVKPHKRKSAKEKMMSTVIADIANDEKGNLYVLWGENMGRSYYRVDVYNNRGKFIGFFELKVSEEGFFNSIAVSSRSVYLCETQIDGLVYRYRIESGGL